MAQTQAGGKPKHPCLKGQERGCKIPKLPYARDKKNSSENIPDLKTIIEEERGDLSKTETCGVYINNRGGHSRLTLYPQLTESKKEATLLVNFLGKAHKNCPLKRIDICHLEGRKPSDSSKDLYKVIASGLKKIPIEAVSFIGDPERDSCAGDLLGVFETHLPASVTSLSLGVIDDHNSFSSFFEKSFNSCNRLTLTIDLDGAGDPKAQGERLKDTLMKVLKKVYENMPKL